MIHHTLVFENKNVKTGFTTWYIWRCSLIQRHPTSGIYDFLTFILNSLFRLCVNKVNWTIEMLSFSTRMREMLTTNFFPYKLIPYELYWFFSGLTCMYLKGAYLKYSGYGPKKKFLETIRVFVMTKQLITDL